MVLLEYSIIFPFYSLYYYKREDWRTKEMIKIRQKKLIVQPC